MTWYKYSSLPIFLKLPVSGDPSMWVFKSHVKYLDHHNCVNDSWYCDNFSFFLPLKTSWITTGSTLVWKLHKVFSSFNLTYWRLLNLSRWVVGWIIKKAIYVFVVQPICLLRYISDLRGYHLIVHFKVNYFMFFFSFFQSPGNTNSRFMGTILRVSWSK